MNSILFNPRTEAPRYKYYISGSNVVTDDYEVAADKVATAADAILELLVGSQQQPHTRAMVERRKALLLHRPWHDYNYYYTLKILWSLLLLLPSTTAVEAEK